VSSEENKRETYYEMRIAINEESRRENRGWSHNLPEKNRHRRKKIHVTWRVGVEGQAVTHSHEEFRFKPPPFGGVRKAYCTGFKRERVVPKRKENHGTPGK